MSNSLLIHMIYFSTMYIHYLIGFHMKVWDVSIIETQLERFYDSELGEFIDAIQQNITVLNDYAY
jgi:hypothetical protein